MRVRSCSLQSIIDQIFSYSYLGSECCCRNCFPRYRDFEMHVMDNQFNEVMHFSRPCRCGGICCCCFNQVLDVFQPPGYHAGRIQEYWPSCLPKFTVTDETGALIYIICGPCCTGPMCCNNIEFEIQTPDGVQEVGKIHRLYTGILRERFTDASMFVIDFPLGCSIKHKAILMGATFLIDFVYYEHDNDDRNHRQNRFY